MRKTQAMNPPENTIQDTSGTTQSFSEQLLPMIERWVRFESPSHSDEALRGMARILVEDAISLGLNAVTQPLSTAGAPLVHIHHRRAGATPPATLVFGHYDTVHPIGTLAKNTIRTAGDKLTQPD